MGLSTSNPDQARKETEEEDFATVCVRFIPPLHEWKGKKKS